MRNVNQLRVEPVSLFYYRDLYFKIFLNFRFKELNFKDVSKQTKVEFLTYVAINYNYVCKTDSKTDS